MHIGDVCAHGALHTMKTAHCIGLNHSSHSLEGSSAGDEVGRYLLFILTSINLDIPAINRYAAAIILIECELIFEQKYI